MGAIWLGGSDFTKEGTFQWNNQEKSEVSDHFQRWMINQPDNWRNREHCMEMLSNGLWNDQNCKLRFGRQVLCEKTL